MTPLSHPVMDCHVHILDPDQFPYLEHTFYRPAGQEIGTARQLGYLYEAHGIGAALLVEPNSGYDDDNRCMLDAIAHSQGRYKGIAVVRSDASRDQLQELQGQGVVGIAMQPALLGTDHYADMGPLLERVRELGMWAQVQVQHDQLLDMSPMLLGSGAKLLFDHCGRADPARGIDQPGFAALLALGRSGRACVKLSALLKSSAQAFPHEDAWPFVHALVDAFGPDQLMWGTDWPHLRAPAHIDVGPLLLLIRRLLPQDADFQRKVLWDTPRRLFGFE